jgi:hypothetical protein
VPVPSAPDGVSVVGTIVVGANVDVVGANVGANVGVDVVGANVGANVGVDVVGANVGVDVVGANVGVDVVGASVGVAAAYTPPHWLRCSAGACWPHGDVPRVALPAMWCPLGTLEYSLVPARTARGPSGTLGSP